MAGPSPAAAGPDESAGRPLRPAAPRAAPLVALWRRLCLFLAAPLLLVWLPVYLIDPYGLFRHPPIIAESLRLDTAARVNQVLLAIVAFARNPKPNILLGDSQMAHFDSNAVSNVAGRPFANLSYGGGTLAESIATFWYAARTVRLQSVYFGVSFYSFTDSSRDRVGAAQRIVSRPLGYFSSGDVLEATWDDIAAQFFRHRVNYGPTVDADIFWRQQLGELQRRDSTFSASPQTLAQISDIVRYCRAHHIVFWFVIPPQHTDVGRQLRVLGMQGKYAAFKSAVTGLGPTYDCDVDNAVTRDRSGFQDPFHMSPATAALEAASIWGQRHTLCEVR